MPRQGIDPQLGKRQIERGDDQAAVDEIDAEARGKFVADAVRDDDLDHLPRDPQGPQLDSRARDRD